MSLDADVRPLSAEEVSECAQLMVSSEPLLTLHLPIESALGVLSDEMREVYAIHDTKGVNGFVVLDMRGLVRGYIQILCVRPDCRGQGHGSLLIEWAEKRIFRESPQRLHLRIFVQHWGSTAVRATWLSGSRHSSCLCSSRS